VSEGAGRRALRLTLAAVFMLDGVLHWTATDVFAAITPAWAGDARLVVQATGVLAFLGGAGLLLRRVRRAAGIGLALYCVGVYPSNVHHALANVAVHGATLGWVYHGPRLLLQPGFVWACLWAGGAIDWPLRRPV